jgi:hypothetical protein
MGEGGGSMANAAQCDTYLSTEGEEGALIFCII